MTTLNSVSLWVVESKNASHGWTLVTRTLYTKAEARQQVKSYSNGFTAAFRLRARRLKALPEFIWHHTHCPKRFKRERNRNRNALPTIKTTAEQLKAAFDAAGGHGDKWDISAALKRLGMNG